MTLAPALDCLLVADDLTGACDAAVHFALHGLRPTTVVLDQAPTVSARVLAVSTESRDLTPEEIRRAMSSVAARFPVDEGTLIFKKIDSTLRGNTGLEIAAALDAFHCDAAVVCPAFPNMQRVVERGYLRVTTAPEFVPVDVATRLQTQSRRQCSHVTWEGAAALLATGARIISLDATCDRDLDCGVAAIVTTGRRILWAGSAGLASALARRLGEASAPQPVPTQRGATLFCLGSDHDVTLGQQSRLLEERPCVLLHPHEATRHAIAASLANGNHVVLRIPRGRASAEAVRDLISGAPAAALVVCGGDTASLVCRAAGVTGIELLDEIAPGVPRGILRGGMFDGLPIATKSGGFGNRDTLIQVADFFACPNPT